MARGPPRQSRPPRRSLPLVLKRGDLALSWFSTVATLGTPMDAELEELRVELFFPADDATERYARGR